MQFDFMLKGIELSSLELKDSIWDSISLSEVFSPKPPHSPTPQAPKPDKGYLCKHEEKRAWGISSECSSNVAQVFWWLAPAALNILRITT